MRVLALLAALCLFAIHPASAQSDQPAFNPVTDADYLPSEPLVMAAQFEAEFGLTLPSSLELTLPRHGALDTLYFPATDDGVLLRLIFLQAAESDDDREFLEELQVTNAFIPLQPDAEDPVLARMQIAARLLEQQVFATFTPGDDTARIMEIAPVSLGNMPNAVEMIASFVHPTFGFNALLRAVIFLHPDQEEGYMLIATIDADRVSVVDIATLDLSLTGRVLSSVQID